MDQLASERMVWGLVSRLERVGHYLTPRAVARIHEIISEHEPDNRTEGTQKELAEFIRERMERDTNNETP